MNGSCVHQISRFYRKMHQIRSTIIPPMKINQLYTCCIEDFTITFLAVLPYDPDSKITKNSLYRLEAMGIPIISALENKFTQLQSATGLRLKNSDLVSYCTSKCLEIFIDKWVKNKTTNLEAVRPYTSKIDGFEKFE